MSKAQTADNYTDPALRERLKKQILAGDKGGKPGQWSARKAQLLALEYKKAGGRYTTDKEHAAESQKHLEQWTNENWTTADGNAAEKPDGTMARYLPQKAWNALSPEQRKATDRKKREASRRGQQFVANTKPAKTARRKAASKAPPKAS